jgi:hypothetical protein
MTDSPWLAIAIVWLIVIVLGGVLSQRFTRVPIQSAGLAPRSPTTRRVLPLWLALVLLILIVTAVWLTVRWAIAGSG